MIGDSDAGRDRLRGRRAAREDRRGPRAPAARCAASSSSMPPATGRRRHARRAARARPRARRRRARGAPSARQARRTPHVHLHVGHDRPAEGLRAHARQLPRDPRHGQRARAAQRRRRLIYLYLPLAHSFALLIQLGAFDLGAPLAYFGGDTKQIVPELMEVKPTYLPVGAAHLREDLHAGLGPTSTPRSWPRRPRGRRPRPATSRSAGEEVPADLRERVRAADEQLFANVRALFGGRLRQATSGAAPIAKEILEFFWACGVPVLEGYGMTETATAATTLDAREPQVRHRRRARCPASS